MPASVQGGSKLADVKRVSFPSQDFQSRKDRLDTTHLGIWVFFFEGLLSSCRCFSTGALDAPSCACRLAVFHVERPAVLKLPLHHFLGRGVMSMRCS